MPSDVLTEHVRRRVEDVFAQHGTNSDEIHESILIRDGFYCGRRFHCNSLEAVWFVEENELKLHSQDGVLLEVLPAAPHTIASKAA